MDSTILSGILISFACCRARGFALGLRIVCEARNERWRLTGRQIVLDVEQVRKCCLLLFSLWLMHLLFRMHQQQQLHFLLLLVLMCRIHHQL